MKILFSILSVLLIVAACKQVDKNKAGTAQSSKAEVQCIDKGNVAIRITLPETPCGLTFSMVAI